MIDVMFSFKFVARQIMDQSSNILQRRRHFCFDANHYPPRRRGLHRNRNVWRAAASDLSHYKLESTELAFVCCSGVGLATL